MGLAQTAQHHKLSPPMYRQPQNYVPFLIWSCVFFLALSMLIMKEMQQKQIVINNTANSHVTLMLEDIKSASKYKPHSPSPRWKTVRDKFFAEHPECEGCGAKCELQVIHKLPIAAMADDHKLQSPDPELDEENLVVCCKKPRNCALYIAHSGNYQKFNPDVDDDLKRMRELIDAGDVSAQSALLKQCKDKGVFSRDEKVRQNERAKQ